MASLILTRIPLYLAGIFSSSAHCCDLRPARFSFDESKISIAAFSKQLDPASLPVTPYDLPLALNVLAT
jgi:hypothetical protein